VGNVSGRWLQATNGKSSADASTGMSRNILRYKAIARVATFVDTSEQLSTQTCSECGCVGGPKGLKGLEIREWTCDECGAVHDRDVNAARNILRLGRQTLAEGSSIHTAEVGWRGRHAQYNRIGLSISSAFCSAALGAILGM
jgi:putative transposase